MEYQSVIFDSEAGGGLRVYGYIYKSKTALKGNIQILHGMAEYFERYEVLIDYLTSNGWNVFGIDMLGHGKTYELNEHLDCPKGYFCGRPDAALCQIKDIIKMRTIAEKEYLGSEFPYMLFGHSMGSIIARDIFSVQKYSIKYSGFIFSSTTGLEPAAGLGLFLAKTACLFGAKKKPGKLINEIAFGNYNRKYENVRTKYDWISSDEAEVDAYNANDDLGFLFTHEGFTVLFTCVKMSQSSKSMASLGHAPCLFIYGTEDPVGNFGTGVQKVIDLMKKNGTEPEVIVYPGCRHEIIRDSKSEGKFPSDVENFFSKCLDG